MPKLKAKELIQQHRTGTLEDAKRHAIVTVKEIIKELESIEFNYEIDTLPFYYWNEVIKEIENYHE